MKRNNKLDLHNDPVLPLIFKSTIPVMLAGILTTSYSFIDMIFASRLGSLQVASIAYVTPLFIIIQTIAIGISRGGITIIAKLLGQEKREEASDYATELRIIILFLSLIFTIVGYSFTPFILRLIKVSDELYEPTLIYTRIWFISNPLSLIMQLYMALFKAQGKMYITSRISLVGVMGNTIFNGISVYVLKMGIEGLAYATVCTKVVQVIIMLITYHTSEHDYSLRWRSRIVRRKEIWKKLFTVGLPLSATYASTHFGFLLLNIFINRYGYQAVAAFAIGNRIHSLLFFPSKEIGEGLIPLIAQNWGRKAMDRVKKTIRYGIIYSAAFGILAGVIIQLIKYPIGKFLTNGDEVTYGHVLNYVSLVGWTVIAWAIFHTLQAVFTSFQKTSFTFTVNMIRLWGIRIPGVIAFSYFLPSLREYGVWYTMFISNVVTLIFAIVYFKMRIPPFLASEEEFKGAV
ncbi:MAG: MATE family efflux transporter [Spirochaetales bacterium]|nr:MATE family efflux transporter [Spirochaetales bacterium]